MAATTPARCRPSCLRWSIVARNQSRSTCASPRRLPSSSAWSRRRTWCWIPFGPGVMDKLGCGYDTLKAINPRLVYAALTGYGHTGPYRDQAGHDMNYRGYTGELEQNGISGGPPATGNFQVADLAGGALTCAIGILAAVIGARASGQGAFVDVGMLDGTLALAGGGHWPPCARMARPSRADRTCCPVRCRTTVSISVATENTWRSARWNPSFSRPCSRVWLKLHPSRCARR